MAKILVTFAFRQEGASFEKQLKRRRMERDLTLGQAGAHEIAVFWLGLGVKEQKGFKHAVREWNPEFVINSGFAGAVRTLLEPGDFVLAENFSFPDWSNHFGMTRIFTARGNFASVNEVADSAAKARFNSMGNILALDMESARVDTLCRELDVPCVSARMISDRYDEQIPRIFLAKRICRLKDVSDAIWFSSRMLVLRQRLANRLTDLIELVASRPHGSKR